MPIDREEVRRIARLAYLELPKPEPPLLADSELDRLAVELGAILAHVEELAELDLDVPPTSHGVPLPTQLRPDVVGPDWDIEQALNEAPKRAGDAFVVPKVIE